jgi:hypothetical protein
VFKSYYQAQNVSIWKYAIPALIDLQFHLIARINNMTQVVLEHICVHHNFANTLKIRLVNWSKNVQDECKAPWQVVLGSMNAAFCVFVSFGLWFEVN